MEDTPATLSSPLARRPFPPSPISGHGYDGQEKRRPITMAQTLTAAPAGLLSVSPRIEDRLRDGELTPQQVDDFRDFLADVDRDLLRHRIITDNAYTRWFQTGAATDDELRHFVKQFSVFSNQFLVAALLKVINSPSVPQMRASKEILMNELGVI